MRILELGFGHGQSMEFVGKKLAELGGGTLVGLDPSTQAIETATARFGDELKAAVNLQLLLGGVGTKEDKLPFPDNHFDIIYHLNCFYFWPDLAHGTAECYRVLKPSGKMLSGSKL